MDSRHTVVDALSELPRLGGYFALTARDGSEAAALAELADPETTRWFVSATRAAIAVSMAVDIESLPVRVAASSFQLGVAARLLSPLIGSALCHGSIPILQPDNVFYRISAHHPDLQTSADQLRTIDGPVAGGAAICALLPDLFDPLHHTLRVVAGLPTRVALGNLTSAANGAVTVLAMTRPDLEAEGRNLVAALTRHTPLRDTGDFGRGMFTRHSCCLFYQAPGGGLCGDCVLPAARS
ncbi:MAG: (2Fe-2S)-binding protein [Mycolicibacterium neoaurum]|uniref:(2Fe-2S)-binding protein n=1 Tax=Mycolicibacterium neoaurum TaxID=1795 RepID=UPI002FFB365B